MMMSIGEREKRWKSMLLTAVACGDHAVRRIRRHGRFDGADGAGRHGLPCGVEAAVDLAVVDEVTVGCRDAETTGSD
jgi:hypothetical protein